MCEALTALIEEGKEEGIRQGIKQGILEGKEEGIRILIETCMEFGSSRANTKERLLQKFSLRPESAEHYMNEYWK